MVLIRFLHFVHDQWAVESVGVDVEADEVVIGVMGCDISNLEMGKGRQQKDQIELADKTSGLESEQIESEEREVVGQSAGWVGHLGRPVSKKTVFKENGFSPQL